MTAIEEYNTVKHISLPEMHPEADKALQILCEHLRTCETLCENARQCANMCEHVRETKTKMSEHMQQCYNNNTELQEQIIL